MHCHGATATYTIRIEPQPLAAGSAVDVECRVQVGKVGTAASPFALRKHLPDPDGWRRRAAGDAGDARFTFGIA